MENNINEIKDLLRKGITTAELIELTGDKKAVIKAFELGAKIHGFKKDSEGIERGFLKIECCIKCKELFTDNNVRTAEGWAEAKISGMCEDCFDDLFIGELFSKSDDNDPRDDMDEFDYMQPTIEDPGPPEPPAF